MQKVYTPPSPRPQKTRPANDPPRSPATKTSAQAVPSGNVRFPCSFTINCRRSGIMNNTPSHPPKSAKGKIRQKVNSDPNPRKISAGKVNITPAASDSPAKPEENKRGKSKNPPASRHFPSRSGSLHDIIFENGSPAERPQNANGEHRDR